LAVKEFKFKVFEVRGDDKLEVASGSGISKEMVERECKHYAMMYGQDGPVAVWRNYEEEDIEV